MAKSAFKVVCQRAAVVLGITDYPVTMFPAYDEGDTSIRRLVEAAREASRELQTRDWNALKAVGSFTTLAQVEQTNKLPTDWLRFIPGTIFDADLKRRVCGPMTPEEYQEQVVGFANAVDPTFLLFGDELHLTPAPSAGKVISFWYIRDVIGRNYSGTRIVDFTADTDVSLWDDELLIRGIKWAYLKGEKRSYAQEQADFVDMIEDRLATEQVGRVLDMTGSRGSADDLVRRMKSAALVVSE